MRFCNMIYHYYCEKCKNKEDKEFSMGNAVNFIECKCGGKMIQDILAKRVQSHLPLDYQALESDYHSVDFGGTDDDMEAMLRYNA